MVDVDRLRPRHVPAIFARRRALPYARTMHRGKASLLRMAVVPVFACAGIIALVVVRGGGGDAATTPAPVTTGAFSKAVGAGGSQAAALRARACPAFGRSKRPPAGFPRDLPLPKGTVLTVAKRYQRPGSAPSLVVEGYAPLTLRAAVLFFIRELPAHGYTFGRGDSEPGEAESQLQNRRFRGAWKIVALPGCPRSVGLLVGVSLVR
jgi:hypothetical protein